MSDELQKLVEAHEATNAKLLLRVVDSNIEQKRAEDECARLREQVATLEVEREKFEARKWLVRSLQSDRDAAKADAARLRDAGARFKAATDGSPGPNETMDAYIELESALSATDSAAWLESKIAERTALHVEREKSLEQQVAAAAARAELRARDLSILAARAATMIEGLLPPGDESVGFPEFPAVDLSEAWVTRCDVRDGLRTSPDSDERLRAVLRRVANAGAEAAMSQDRVSVDFVIDEVLRGGA